MISSSRATAPVAEYRRPALRPRVCGTSYLGALCVIAAIAYIQRNCLGVAEEEIRGEFGMTEQEMGWVMGGFFLTYGLFQVPAGWLAQTWGTRRRIVGFRRVLVGWHGGGRHSP